MLPTLLPVLIVAATPPTRRKMHALQFRFEYIGPGREANESPWRVRKPERRNGTESSEREYLTRHQSKHVAMRRVQPVDQRGGERRGEPNRGACSPVFALNCAQLQCLRAVKFGYSQVGGICAKTSQSEYKQISVLTRKDSSKELV